MPHDARRRITMLMRDPLVLGDVRVDSARVPRVEMLELRVGRVFEFGVFVGHAGEVNVAVSALSLATLMLPPPRSSSSAAAQSNYDKLALVSSRQGLVMPSQLSMINGMLSSVRAILGD